VGDLVLRVLNDDAVLTQEPLLAHAYIQSTISIDLGLFYISLKMVLVLMLFFYHESQAMVLNRQ